MRSALFAVCDSLDTSLFIGAIFSDGVDEEYLLKYLRVNYMIVLYGKFHMSKIELQSIAIY